MQTLSQIRALLAQRDLRPRHGLGQNFLHDHNQLLKLLDAADVQSGDLVLEVGPGTGVLTECLLERGARVVACEIDTDMAGIITDHVLPHAEGRLTLVASDIMDSKHRISSAVMSQLDGPFKQVANLPYQVASSLIAALLIHYGAAGAMPRCASMFVTVQREVAQRMIAKEGTKAYGALSVLCQSLGAVELIARLSPGCFWPEPEVASAMAAVFPRDEPVVSDRAKFGGFVVRLFSGRRKQLGSLLGRAIPWPAGITAQQRPEALSPQEFVLLFEALDAGGDPD